MPAATDEMESERFKLRGKMVSLLISDFVGPLQLDSHCHICLESWYPSGEDDITCQGAVHITHKDCQCRDIVIGRSCITSWLLEKDTCPMCRQDLFHLPPPHLRSRHAQAIMDNFSEPEDDEDEDDEHAGEDEEFGEEDLHDQSWLDHGGNFVHSARLDGSPASVGELFSTDAIIELFLNRQTIEECKHDAERDEFYASMNPNHTPQAWDAAYRKFVQGKPQDITDLFTTRGPVCIDGIAVSDEDEIALGNMGW